MSICAALTIAALAAAAPAPRGGPTLRETARATGRTVAVDTTARALLDADFRRALRDEIGSAHVALPWAALEPVRGKRSTALFADALARVQADGIPLHVRLAFDGRDSPRWAKGLDPAATAEARAAALGEAMAAFGQGVTAWSLAELDLRGAAPTPAQIAKLYAAARLAAPEARLFLEVRATPFDPERWKRLPDVLEAIRAAEGPVDGIVVRFRPGAGPPAEQLRAGLVRITALGFDAVLAEDLGGKRLRDIASPDPFLDDASLCFALDGCVAVVLGAPPFDRRGLVTEDYRRIRFSLRPR